MTIGSAIWLFAGLNSRVKAFLGILFMSREANRIELVCKGCGETNPRKFEICWNCARSLEDAGRVESAESPDEDEEVVAEEPEVAPFEPSRLTNWIEVIAVLLVTCYPYLLSQVLYDNAGKRTIDADYLLHFVPYYVGMATVLWILVRRDTLMPQPKSIGKSNWIVEAVYAFLILLANWCLGILVLRFTTNWDIPKNAQANELVFASDAVRAAYAATLFFSALYEEVLFRVYLQAKLQSLMGGRVVVPIIASAVVFAECHGYSLRGTLRIFATGICYGIAYQYGRRVPRIVAAHWMHNLLVLCVQIH